MAAYMTDFYGSRAWPTMKDLHRFVQDCPCGQLEHQWSLEGDVTLEEVQQVVTQLQSWKLQGLNELPVEFLKKLARMVTPHLHRMMCDANGMVQFVPLKEDYDMAPTQPFEYYQLRHVPSERIAPEEDTTEESPLER
ncbi:hypothetical protein NDU88_004754 [Pleurodeles waltl]|uniref:Uncharacterized protein n=1 Tax=Pleurodeles waltl TaxID=8319 RepID=A0AAV7PDR4_PLEWA|nr:hypothetical protein NDU88_004754 [Pleurodeles waltl]